MSPTKKLIKTAISINSTGGLLHPGIRNGRRLNRMRKKICSRSFNNVCTGEPIYFLGFIGAAAYYLLHATSFWDGVLGLLKAIVWPAFFVYGAVKYFGI